MDQAHERDEWLIAQVAAGKPGCMTSLVRRYANPLLTFIWRMIGHRERSEELFQEVFLAVWAKRRQYQFPRPFRPWLYAIALNKCREALRRGNWPAEAPLLDDDVLPTPPNAWSDPAGKAVATETAAFVREAVSLLPAKQRMVVVLRVWSDLSYAEIADVLGCREGTVRSNMHDALASMRRYLEPRMR